MDKHVSNWWRDVITLIFDLWGHRACQWCGSSYSIRIPSLKFIDLPILKRWCVFRPPLIGWPWPLTTKWGHGSHVSWASIKPIFSLLCPSFLDLGSGMGQTDGQKDNGHHCIIPHRMGWEQRNNDLSVFV